MAIEPFLTSGRLASLPRIDVFIQYPHQRFGRTQRAGQGRVTCDFPLSGTIFAIGRFCRFGHDRFLEAEGAGRVAPMRRSVCDESGLIVLSAQADQRRNALF
jgi:hypothetical protein